MSPEETIKSVEEGGLKLKKIIEVPSYHYGAVLRVTPIEDLAYVRYWHLADICVCIAQVRFWG